MIGKKTYSTLKDLCLPDLPADKTYEELTEILKGFYKPKVLEVAETYRFHHTVQSENESVTKYANKLKCLAVNCNFGQYLTRALRDSLLGVYVVNLLERNCFLKTGHLIKHLKWLGRMSWQRKSLDSSHLMKNPGKANWFMVLTSNKLGITISSLLTKAIQKRKNVSGVDLHSIWLTSVPISVLHVITVEKRDTWQKSVLQKRIEKRRV